MDNNSSQKAIQLYNKGLNYLDKGRLSDAAKAFQDSILLDPTDPDVFNNLGVVLFRLNHIDASIISFNQAIEMDEEYARYFNNAGVGYYHRGVFDKAYELLLEAIKLDDTYIPAYLNLSLLCKEKLDVASSINYYQRALQLSKPVYKGSKTNVLGFDLLGRKAPETPDVFNITQFDLLISKDTEIERGEITIDEILNTYKTITEIEIENAISNFNMGVALFKNKQYEESLKYFKRAVSLNPDFAEAYYNLGLCHEKCGELDDAARSYAKAVEKAPSIGGYLSLAVVLYTKGNYSKALEVFSKAANSADETADTYNNLGYALYKMGKISDAIEYYRKAIEIDPSFHIAYYNLGVVLGKLGEIEESIDAYERVIEINPENAPAFNNIGVAYEKLEDYDKALEFYEKALSVSPNYTTAYENMFNLLKKHRS